MTQYDKIEIPIAVLDGLVVAGLKAAALTLCEAVLGKPLARMPHHYEDMQNDLRVLGAINEVLEYFGEPAISVREEAAKRALREP